MTASLAGWRAAAFVVVALAALAGVMSRMATARPDEGSFAGVEALSLSPGQPFGSATFDGIAREDVPSVRLRTIHCGEPIFAAPMQLRAVAEVDLADRAYLGRPGYDATNVYRDEVRKTFSHLARVLARSPLTPFRLDYFVRFYAPSNCAIDDHDYVEWAQRILALGTKSPQPGQSD